MTRLKETAVRHKSEIKALVWVSVIADETDAGAIARWERYKAGTDLVALGWKREQVSADVSNADDPHGAVGRLMQAREPSPTSVMKLIESYATVAKHLDRMAQVPGLAGVMLLSTIIGKASIVSVSEFNR